MNVMSVALTTEVKKSMQVMPCATSEKDAVRVGVQQVQDHQARRRDVRCGREQGGRARKKKMTRKTATTPKPCTQELPCVMLSKNDRRDVAQP